MLLAVQRCTLGDAEHFTFLVNQFANLAMKLLGDNWDVHFPFDYAIGFIRKVFRQ